MMTLSIFAGLAFAGWGVAGITSAFAPKGYQDETGFHYGAPAREMTSGWVAAPPHAVAQPA